MLSKTRYLTGNQLTEADVRLFMTLIRFDEIYVVYFKTNKKRISEYPNISNYVKDLYQTPGKTSGSPEEAFDSDCLQPCIPEGISYFVSSTSILFFSVNLRYLADTRNYISRSKSKNSNSKGVGPYPSIVFSYAIPYSLWQTPHQMNKWRPVTCTGLGSSINLPHCKMHYYTSVRVFNICKKL